MYETCECLQKQFKMIFDKNSLLTSCSLSSIAVAPIKNKFWKKREKTKNIAETDIFDSDNYNP